MRSSATSAVAESHRPRSLPLLPTASKQRSTVCSLADRRESRASVRPPPGWALGQAASAACPSVLASASLGKDAARGCNRVRFSDDREVGLHDHYGELHLTPSGKHWSRTMGRVSSGTGLRSVPSHRGLGRRGGRVAVKPAVARRAESDAAVLGCVFDDGVHERPQRV